MGDNQLVLQLESPLAWAVEGAEAAGVKGEVGTNISLGSWQSRCPTLTSGTRPEIAEI